MTPSCTPARWGLNHPLPATRGPIITGSGDPTPGRPHWVDSFNHWTLALRAAGPGEIHGRLIAEETG